MKKWLAALFFCLLMIPAALAEDLFAEVCGLWRWETTSPATALGDGVYFHVDGSCVLYEASEYDEYHTDMITGLTPCAEGTWTALGDTVLVAAGDAVHTLPVEAMSWQDWDYTDGLRIGEGAYLPGFGVPAEGTVPTAILEDINAWHPGATLEDYAELPDVGGRPMAFALIRQKEGLRQLRMYELDEMKGWRLWDDFDAQIPQIDLPNAWIRVEKAGVGSYDEAGSLWYNEEDFDYVYPSGAKVGVWTSNGETYGERVEFVWEGDGFYLHHYGDSPGNMIDLAGDDLIFYNIGWGYEGRVYCPFSRSIYAVDFYQLPRRISDVRIMGEAEPPLPESVFVPLMNRQVFLVKQDVKLKSGKYPVYMGPGKEYGRAANGKASVSTNGWVQVFGEYEGWLLIHYAISAEQYRFGWITADALSAGQKISALPLVFGDFTNADWKAPLTDDPLNSHNELVTIPAGTAIEYLAQLGEGYSYVRVAVDGKTWWGFVSTWPLGHG